MGTIWKKMGKDGKRSENMGKYGKRWEQYAENMRKSSSMVDFQPRLMTGGYRIWTFFGAFQTKLSLISH